MILISKSKWRTLLEVTYFTQEPAINSGVWKKINSQVDSLRKNGVNTTLVLPTSQNRNNSTLKKNEISHNLITQIFRYILVSKTIYKIIKKNSDNHILYLRFLAPNPFLWFVFQFPRRCKIVVEYQSIDLNEVKLSPQKYRYFLMDFLFGQSIRKKSDAIVGVTDEITRYELKRIGNPKKPHITIGNGFEVDSVLIRKTRSYDNTELHLLCVAQVSKWHGLDRLLEGIATYGGNTRIIFHIAGDGAEIPLITQMVEKLNIKNNVVFHGFKTGEDLDTLFNTCHIAVGSLGLHRIGLVEASILKAREYCARGIPYIIACADPDFPEDFPWVLRIPVGESPIDIDKIIEFAQRVYADPDHPQKMGAYAKEHLDWPVKMKKLTIFLEKLVNE